MTEKKSDKTKKQTTKKKQDSKTKKANTKKTSFKKEFDILTDKHIRLKAEFENFRKRKNKETLMAHTKKWQKLYQIKKKKTLLIS